MEFKAELINYYSIKSIIIDIVLNHLVNPFIKHFPQSIVWNNYLKASWPNIFIIIGFQKNNLSLLKKKCKSKRVFIQPHRWSWWEKSVGRPIPAYLFNVTGEKNNGGVKGFRTNASKNHFYFRLAVITSFTIHFNLSRVRRLAKQTVQWLILSCRKTKSDAQQLHARGNAKLWWLNRYE